MIHVFHKAAPGDANIELAHGLSLKEFQCQCTDVRCKSVLVHERLIISFTKLRLRADTPFKINSGFRCALHNFTMPQKGNEYSRHMYGAAVDVVIDWNKIDKDSFIKMALEAGFEKALWYPIGFVHLQTSLL